ncbi:hypothetical protein ACFX13_033407 [Malus domestica]
MIYFGPMLVDPLFLYVPIINLPYVLKIIYHVLRTWWKLNFLEDLPYLDDENEMPTIPKSPIHNILAVLPIPQIIILIFLLTTRDSRSLNIMKFLNLLILL